MKCADVVELLSAYLDDELNSGERARISAHLDACGECRQALERLRTTSRLLCELPRPIAPSHITDPALALVRARPQVAQPAGWSALRGYLDSFRHHLEWRALAVAAGTIAVLIIGAHIVRENMLSTGQAPDAISASMSRQNRPAATPDLTGLLRAADPEAAARAVQELIKAEHGRAIAAATGDRITVDAVVPDSALSAIEAEVAKLGEWQVSQRRDRQPRDVEVRIEIAPQR